MSQLSKRIATCLNLLWFCHFALAEEAPTTSEPILGWAFSEWTREHTGLSVSGWAQASYAQGSEGNVLLPATFFRREEGFTIDMVGLIIEKQPVSNVLGRIGPLPMPKPESFDWGIYVNGAYGADNFFFRTYGLDDNWGLNRPDDFGNTDYYATLTQAFIDLYFPVLGGSNLMLGLFHSPLANEIGFALPAPAPATFYTHPYSFMHGPAKHFGALWSSKLDTAPGEDMWGFEVGIVNGWNNLQDPNNDLDLILSLRWRSADFKTWVDLEGIYGNGADDSFPDCRCGSPIVADSVIAGDDNLPRYAVYLTVSHQLESGHQFVTEFTVGHQEKALFPTLFNEAPFGVPSSPGQDGDWYGVNVNWFHQISSSLHWNVRAEYFHTDGVHVLTPFAGKYKAITTNLSWFPTRVFRLRPEIRYDHYSGDATPFGASDPTDPFPPLLSGEHTRQWVFAMDASFYF